MTFRAGIRIELDLGSDLRDAVVIKRERHGTGDLIGGACLAFQFDFALRVGVYVELQISEVRIGSETAFDRFLDGALVDLACGGYHVGASANDRAVSSDVSLDLTGGQTPFGEFRGDIMADVARGNGDLVSSIAGGVSGGGGGM